MNDLMKQFRAHVKGRINAQGNNQNLKNAGQQFVIESILSKYSYNYSWLGVPIIQYPQDMIAMQEIIWDIKPDLIIETGIAHGGSLVYYASLLDIIGNGTVLGIDIDIRSHNRAEIEKHPMYKRIHMLEGSSVEPEIFQEVEKISEKKEKILVVLDSNHTFDHVYKELELYSSLVSVGSYLVVFDTIVETLADLDIDFSDRPWGKGNNPMTAVKKFLVKNDSFVIDKEIENKLLITVAPDGYLKRIK